MKASSSAPLPSRNVFSELHDEPFSIAKFNHPYLSSIFKFLFHGVPPYAPPLLTFGGDLDLSLVFEREVIELATCLHQDGAYHSHVQTSAHLAIQQL